MRGFSVRMKTPRKTHEVHFLTISVSLSLIYLFILKGDKLALSSATASLVGEPVLIEKVGTSRGCGGARFYSNSREIASL